jgi:iron complex outermembrane receptor protein
VAPSCDASIDGHAVDAVSHEPIAGATVRIGDSLVATTDEAGRFEVGNVCKGEVELVIEREDCKPVTRVLKVAGRVSLEIELAAAGEVIELRDKAPPPPDMRSATTVTGAALERSRGKSFTAAIAEVPGVAELRAATGVAKPIIRGQFGRRLLMLVDGVRHRAQEWGLDHAPEIDPFIADAIRVVRGPGGVRYGSDAIGGAVLVEPPDLRREGHGGELHLIGASNGRGGTIAGRLQNALGGGLGLQLEGSAKRLAAARAPDYALDNTGVFEWTAGATLGYRRRRGEYRLSARHYSADVGVCSCLRIHNVDDFLAQARAGEPIGADQYRADLAIDRPKQSVQHDLALARARWELAGKGTLTSTYSFQHDRRRELDVVRQGQANIAQFNFRLFTHEVDTTFEHAPYHLSEHWHLRGAAGVIGTLQTHAYSGLPLIPSYIGIGAGAFAVERLVGHDTDVELGARYDVLSRTASIERDDFLRLVRSDQLAMDACGGGSPDPVKCSSRYRTFTTSLGVAQRLADVWSLKAEASIASRAPNPDEQYLNGTAPTFPVLGLGKPDVRPETTYSSSITLSLDTPRLTGEASAFANRIDDYIYFAPAIGADGMPIFDVLIRGTFPRFATTNIDALFYGADGGITAAPAKWIELAGQASLVRAKDADSGGFLVFVPPDRYRGSVTLRAPDTGSFKNSFATLSSTYVTRQRRFDLAADFVRPPGAYVVIGAELGTETCLAGHKTRLALQGANLTNTRYRDYTSLMRYFADEVGWQAWLRMSVFFDSETKNQKGHTHP